MEHTLSHKESAPPPAQGLQGQFREPKRHTLLERALRFVCYSPLGTASLIFLLGLVCVAVAAERLMLCDPLLPDYTLIKSPPSAGHWLGTDYLGRDVFSRLILGTRATLFVALTSGLFGTAVGAIWGIVSGYVGGRFDLLSQRLVDIMLAFPFLILALLLMAALRPGLHTVIFAISVASIAPTSRTLRSMVLSVKECDYIMAARAIGARDTRILRLHVAPQTIGLFVVILAMRTGSAVFAESAMSFLGVGVPPPSPSWGNMLGGVITQAFHPPWWVVLFPGLAISMTILALNLVGDTLRDWFDPRLLH